MNKILLIKARQEVYVNRPAIVTKGIYKADFSDKQSGKRCADKLRAVI